MAKNAKNAKNAPNHAHYSLFVLTKKPKNFETILGRSSFFSAVSHGITLQ